MYCIKPLSNRLCSTKTRTRFDNYLFIGRFWSSEAFSYLCFNTYPLIYYFMRVFTTLCSGLPLLRFFPLPGILSDNCSCCNLPLPATPRVTQRLPASPVSSPLTPLPAHLNLPLCSCRFHQHFSLTTTESSPFHVP